MFINQNVPKLLEGERVFNKLLYVNHYRSPLGIIDLLHTFFDILDDDITQLFF